MITQEQLLLNFENDDIVWKTAIVPKKEELFEGLYECSNKGGLVRDAKTRRVLPMRYDKNGYRRISLKSNTGICYTLSVHRIIAATFCFNPDPHTYIEVNHIDGDPANNDASNLEWVTRQMNEQHKNNYLKSDLSHFKLIVAIKEDEKYYFKSIKEVAKKLGVSEQHLRDSIRGSIYKIKKYKVFGYKSKDLLEIITFKKERPDFLNGVVLEEYL